MADERTDENRRLDSGGAGNDDATPQRGLTDDQASQTKEVGSIQRSPASERFRFVGQLARGGLGVLSVAIDDELNRKVALKQIRPEKAQESVYRTKFLREAQITGNLEHPGVVPVYGMGTDALGNLFYAMQLIHGDTLSTLITDHWQKTDSRSCTFHDPQLMTLLDHFLAVCQTIAYAHRRGVLHRDLKPENVMIGAYGETLVVDWGLAKAIDADDEDTANDFVGDAIANPDVSVSAAATRFGTAMGTPAYASPEMILGQILDVDRRSDIYGLGAILYELLAGHAPVKGATIEELKSNAADGKIDPLQRVAPYVPAALSAICMKCLRPERDDRYQAVTDVIADVQQWKADQPVTALPDTWWQKTTRWLRHHRSIARSGFAAIAGAAIVSIAAGVIFYRQRQVFAELAKENRLLAESEAQQNQKMEAVRNLLVDTFRSPDPHVDGKSIRVIDLLDRTANQLRTSVGGDVSTRASMLLAIGQSYLGLGQPEQAVLHIRQSMQLFDSQQFGDVLTGDSANRKERMQCAISLGEALRAAGSLETSRDVLQQTIQDLQRRPLSDEILGLASCQLAETCLQAGAIDDADTLLIEIVDTQNRSTQDEITLLAREGLGRVRIAQAKYQIAADLLRQAYKERCDFSGAEDPVSLKTRTSLAEAIQRLNRPDEAAKIYDSILKIQQERLGSDHPETLVTKNNLAFAYRQLLRYEDATELFQQTHQALKERLGTGHPDTLVAANNLSEAYEVSGRYEEAETLLDDTLEQMARRLSHDHPDLLIARYNLARVYESTSRYTEAIKLLRDVVHKRSRKLGPEHADTQRAQIALGGVLFADGRRLDARQTLSQAIDVMESRQGVDQVELLKAKLLLAAVNSNDQNVQATTEKMVKIVAQLEAELGFEHPTSLAAINQQATTLLRADRSNEAISLLSELHGKCIRRLSAEHPRTLVVAMNLAVAYRESMQLIESIPLLEETITQMRVTLGPDHGHTLTATRHLVDAYRQTQWFPQAIELLEEILQRSETGFGVESSKTQSARLDLAIALIEAKQANRAVELLKLREFSLQNADVNSERRVYGLIWLGIASRETEQIGNSEQALRKAVEVSSVSDPSTWTTAWAKATLADTLLLRNQYEEALSLLVESETILKRRRDQLPEHFQELPGQIAEAIRRVRREQLGDGESRKNEQPPAEKPTDENQE